MTPKSNLVSRIRQPLAEDLVGRPETIRFDRHRGQAGRSVAAGRPCSARG